MKIINDHFEVGQRYIGMVNPITMTVVRIQEAGEYPTPYGTIRTVRQTQVHFRDDITGQIYVRDLETAKRLQLKRMEG